MASINEAKELIKNTPISSIIMNYMPITKKGANYEGICPFHSDGHPSLKVNDNKGIYKCFACGAAGDSIKFVQDKLNLSFVEAVKEVASKIGLTVDESKSANPRVEMSLRILKAANKIYRKVAMDMSPQNFKDFQAKRNLSPEIIEEFQIGFAPSNNSLFNYLQSIPGNEKGKALALAEELGVIRKSYKGNGHYDFFRERVTFPIWDHSGKVRGFSSRAVLENQKPKYLNSGESFIFDKGNILYGFHLSKQAIREQDAVIIVEGNMDAVMLHQYGFKNSVATMGVALSEKSAQLLKGMCSKVYLAMDSDDAGIKAMGRINDTFLSLGVCPLFIDFSPAKDPDEYLNQFGRLKLLEKLENAPNFVDYMFEKTLSEVSPSTTDQKLEVLNKSFELLLAATNNLWAQEKATEYAKVVGISSSKEDILAAFKQRKEGTRPFVQAQPAPAPVPIEETPPPTAIESNQFALESPLDIGKAQQSLLTALLTYPELITGQQIPEILDLIEHFEVKRIVLWLKDIYLEIDESDYTHFLQNKLSENSVAEIAKSFNMAISAYKKDYKITDKVKDKMLADLKKKLEIEKLNSLKTKLKIQRAQTENEQESISILTQIQDLEVKLANIKK